MSARPLHTYDPDDEHVVTTRRAATMLKLVPSLREPQPVVEFVPDQRHFRSWKLQTAAPVRYAACLVSYAAAHASVAVSVDPAPVAIPAQEAASATASAESLPAAATVPNVVDIDTEASVLSIDDGAVVVDIAGMAVVMHAPELPIFERGRDVVEYTRAVVNAAFAEVGIAA